MGFSLPTPGKKVYWIILALFLALVIVGSTRDCGAECPDVVLTIPDCPDCVCPEVCPEIDEVLLAELLAEYCPVVEPPPPPVECETITIYIPRPQLSKYSVQGGLQSGATGDGGVFAGFTWYPKNRWGLTTYIEQDFSDHNYSCTRTEHSKCYHREVTTTYSGADRTRYGLGVSWAF